MPVTQNVNDPNYTQLVSQLSQPQPGVNPKQNQQNADQQMSAFQRIAEQQKNSGAGSTGKPLPGSTSYSSMAPGSPNGGGVADSPDSASDYQPSLEEGAGAHALGGAAGEAAGGAMSGEGIESLLEGAELLL